MKTKTKILKVFAIIAIFLASSHLMAQTLSSNAITQTVCINTLAEPYEVVNNTTSTYTWSIIDQATGLAPPAGVADITVSANDWFINIDWTTVGIYELSVVETDVATNCSSVPIVLTITVEDNANAPVAINPAPICLNDPNPIMTATTGGGTGSGVFNWYADNFGAPGTLLLANSATYTDPILYPTDGTYDYWVTEESSNGCEGVATQVTITVTPLPAAPTLVNTPYAACFGEPNPLFTASGSGGTNFNWYDASGTILPLGTNTPTFTSTESAVSVGGPYIYYVEEVVGSCTSPQTQFDFTIHPPPSTPSVTPAAGITICEGDIPSDFIANTGGVSGTFNWYDVDPVANPGAVAIFTGSPFTPNQTAPGTYTYWLTETDLTTTCVSPASTSTFTINELPLQPTVSANPDFTICDGEPAPTFTAAQAVGSVGTGDYNWYDNDPALPGATLLGTGPTFTPALITPGTQTTFWLTETNATTTCEGPAVSFTFAITALPAVPVLAINPVEICFGDANLPFVPTGVSSAGANLIWYDDAALTNQVGTGATFTAPVTVVGSPTLVSTYSYWVVDQPGTCVSPSLQVDLQINPLPTPGPIWHN